MNLTLTLVLATFLGADATTSTETIAAGKGVFEIPLDDYRLQVYTYRPANYSPEESPLFVVFHGQGRNADEYRDYVVPLADRCNALVIAPCFDKPQFPFESYNYGNLLDGETPRPAEQWTFSLVPRLIAHVRSMEGRPEMPYYLMGHSAGGQFVERLVAFVVLKPVAVVSANPGSQMFPTRDYQFPYGFGELPDSLGGDEALRRYLAVPLTVYLGTADIDTTMSSLDQSPTALKQGPHRLARGRACFAAAQAMAQSRGWPCNWKLVEAEGVAHSGSEMFRHEQMLKALNWKEAAK